MGCENCRSCIPKRFCHFTQPQKKDKPPRKQKEDYSITNRTMADKSNTFARTRRMNLPYPFIILTISYFVYATTIHTYAPECLHTPCNSEGIDNTTSGWATDFFLTVAMLLFAYHLTICPRRVHCSAIAAQIYMGLAYLMGGISHLFFPNSGLGDGYGMLGFYIAWASSYTFITLSTIAHYRFIIDVTNRRQNQNRQKEKQQQRQRKVYFRRTLDRIIRTVSRITMTVSSTSQRRRRRRTIAGTAIRKSISQKMSMKENFTLDDKIAFVHIFLGLFLFSYFIIMIGCTWCAVTPTMHTTQIIDEYEGFPDDGPTCVQLFVYSEGIFFLCYGLFWIPAGQLLVIACRLQQQEQQQQREEESTTTATVAVTMSNNDQSDDNYHVSIGNVNYDNDKNEIEKETSSVSTFWGFSTAAAAASLIPTCQWTIGFSFIFYIVAIALTLNIDPVLLYKMVYGAIIYHFGNLLTFYFAHTVSYALATN